MTKKLPDWAHRTPLWDPQRGVLCAPKRVAIIGAGIAGLVAAYELTKSGYEVIVYEKNSYPGGRMRTSTEGGMQFDSGAIILSANYRTLKKYSDELGVEWSPMAYATTHRVLRNGKAYLYGLKGPLDILRLNVISLRSRLKFLAWLIKISTQKVTGSFFDLTTTTPETNTDSASHYLRKKVSDELVDYIVDPFTAGLHFYLSDEISTAALFTLMKMISSDPDFGARNPKGGVQAIPNALARKVNVRYETDVLSVSPGNLVRTKDKEGKFDVVVFACPAPVAQALLTEPTSAQKKLLESVAYGGTATISFKVPANFFADSTNCIYVPYRENQIISTCIFEGCKGEDRVKECMTLFNVYLHAKAAEELLQKTDAEIIAAVMPEIKKVCPEFTSREKDISFHAIERWPLAIPKYTPGLVTAVREFLQTGQGAGGVYFTGDYMAAPWTEGAAQSGKRTAKLVTESLSE